MYFANSINLVLIVDLFECKTCFILSSLNMTYKILYMSYYTLPNVMKMYSQTQANTIVNKLWKYKHLSVDLAYNCSSDADFQKDQLIF